MKIKTNNEHKSFKIKEFTKNPKIKRFLRKTEIFVLCSGMLAILSGCGKNFGYEDNLELYKEESQQYVHMYRMDQLSESGLEELTMYYSPIDEDFIDNLPPDLKCLDLTGDQFILDLSNLPNICPNLESLYITDCFGISNWDFIKEFKNLKNFAIYGESIGVTDELIRYLDSKGIEHNLTEHWINIDKQVDEIVKSIITDDMTDDEKMEAITNYVINNVKYDRSALTDYEKAMIYNKLAISSALEGHGVCANYAALTNALCAKAGITSYFVNNENHAWNLVKLDGKYYYIDTTNICQIPIISKLIFKYFGKGIYYKQDPYHTGLSAMSDLNEINLPSVPPFTIKKLIDEAEDEKTFMELYGSNADANLIAILGVAIGLGVCVKVVKKKIRGY